MNRIISLVIFVFIVNILAAQDIKINQIGFYQKSQKLAIVPETADNTFSVIELTSGSVAYSGSLSSSSNWTLSGESNIKVADFSDFTEKGTYYIVVGNKQSHKFDITDAGLFKDISIWTIKAFYLWRASTAIESKYATFNGIDYSRAAGHADTAAVIHSSAATAARPTGTVVSSPKGWYDAGDYNKYVVNANPAVFPMLHAYELYPEYYNKLNLNIPESNNELPDLLDEVKWETDWLLTMQDPNDGGVYFKLTDANFTAMELPSKVPQGPRYLVKKSTTSALDFAAMMAKTYRTFRNFETLFPGYADSCLNAAKYAYQWAKANPNITFSNPTGIYTGQYGDNNLSDEFYYAQIELFLATSDSEYLNNLPKIISFDAPSWPNVQTNGLLSIMAVIDTLQISDSLKNIFTKAFYNAADHLEYRAKNEPYRISLNSFSWGSNGDAASQGMLLAAAYKYSQNEKYINAAISMLDYILGRNATPYCFITGFGKKSPMHIHDRRAEGDNIVEPLPGYLAGGPTASHQASDCGVSQYPSSYPAKSYLDKECSYSTNEIAINWNGPLVFLTGAIESHFTNSDLKPTSIKTDTTGSIITIEYSDELFAFNNSDINYSIAANSQNLTIDSVYQNPLAKNEIIVILTDSVEASDTLISINSSIDSVFSTSDVRVASLENQNVLNYVKGAAPIVINAISDTLGQSVILTFNKEITSFDSITTGFTVLCNGNNVALYAESDISDLYKIKIYTSQIYKYDYIGFSYSANFVVSKEGGKMNKVNLLPIQNIAPERPSQLITATCNEDGYTLILNFDKPIIAGNLKTPISIQLISNTDTTDINIHSFNITDNLLTIKTLERIKYGDKLILNSLNEGLKTINNKDIYPFINRQAVNSIPYSTTRTIDTALIVKIQAESYAYNYGFESEVCSDIDGGKNLGYTDKGDWLDYFIDVKTAGTYSIILRVASESQESKALIQTIDNNTVTDLTSIKTPITGGWQKWESVFNTIELKEGKQILRVYASDALFNINWLEIRYGIYKPVNINEEISENVIYPNPCNDICYINIEYDCVVTVTSSLGKKMLSKKAEKGEVIELQLEPGVYVVNFGNIKKTIIAR